MVTVTVEQLRRQRQEAAKQKRIKQAQFARERKVALRSRTISEKLKKGSATVLKSKLSKIGINIKSKDVKFEKVTATVKVKGVSQKTTVERPVVTLDGFKISVDPLRRSLRIRELGAPIMSQTRQRQAFEKLKQLEKPKSPTLEMLLRVQPKAVKKDSRLTGRIDLATKPKDVSAVIEKQRQIAIRKTKTSDTQFKRTFQGVVVLGSLGVAKGLVGVSNIFISPIKTAKGFASFAKAVVSDPVKIIQEQGKQFAVDPVGTVAEFLTFSKALNLVSKATARSPAGRFVNEELFIAQQPKPLRASVRSIIKSSKVQEKINPSNVKSLNKVDFAEVKSLSRLEAKALKKALQQTDSVVFGSLASRTISRKKTPIPKDVDIATKNINTFSQKFIDNLPKKKQVNYTIKGEKVIRKSNNEALFDIKPLSRLFPDKSIFSKKGFLPVSGYVTRLTRGTNSILPRIRKKLGFAPLEIPTQKLIKVEGIKLTGFGEQTLRKGLGTLQVLLEKNLKRAKDPQAFIVSLEIQLSALKKKPKTIIINRKVKVIEDALRILKSKAFEKLLASTGKTILEQFPILKKINKQKLKKARLLTKKQTRISIEKKLAKRKGVKRSPTAKRKLTKRKASKVPKKKPSGVPSKIPKKRPSRVPSRVPKKRPSKVPSKPPSRVPKKKPSKVPSKPPSKVPKKRPSKAPSKPPSKVPKKRPSRVPSKTPSRIPKRVPKAKPKFKFKKLKDSETLPDFVKRVLKSERKTKFTPSLDAILRNIRSTKKSKKAFTGLELRPIVIKIKNKLEKEKKKRVSKSKKSK